MKNHITLLLMLTSAGAWGCGGITIKNGADFEIWVGYDFQKLWPIPRGEILELEEHLEIPLIIKSNQQSCMYKADGFVEVSKLREQQFVVRVDGKTTHSSECQ